MGILLASTFPVGALCLAWLFLFWLADPPRWILALVSRCRDAWRSWHNMMLDVSFVGYENWDAAKLVRWWLLIARLSGRRYVSFTGGVYRSTIRLPSGMMAIFDGGLFIGRKMP